MRRSCPPVTGNAAVVSRNQAQANGFESGLSDLIVHGAKA